MLFTYNFVSRVRVLHVLIRTLVLICAKIGEKSRESQEALTVRSCARITITVQYECLLNFIFYLANIVPHSTYDFYTGMMNTNFGFVYLFVGMIEAISC